MNRAIRDLDLVFAFLICIGCVVGFAHCLHGVQSEPVEVSE